MSIFLQQASKEQEIVIKAKNINNSPIVVVAGAGSGKTTTIINRIGYHIEQKNMNPFEILALSFSNKSANEIIERVKNKIGSISTGLQAGTFHSIALQILKKNSKIFNEYKILDSDDDKKFIKTIYDKIYGDELKKIKEDLTSGKIELEEAEVLKRMLSSVSDIQWIISRSKNTNENVFDIIMKKVVFEYDEIEITRPSKYKNYNKVLFDKEENNTFSDELLKTIKEYSISKPDLFYKNIKYLIKTLKEYELEKQKHKYLSFDDLLINVVEFLNKKENIRAKIDEKYKYVFVDEFQDVNYIQMEFIKLINKDYNYLLVVGDADQAIYSFRGCDSYYFNNVRTLYSKTRIYELNDNYRSDGHIIALANNLIENNYLRYKKTMKPIKEYINVPKLINKENEKDLYKSIILKIKELNDFSETAILYRNNSNSLQIQKVLIENKIPFKVYGGQNIFNKKYSKDLRAFVSILEDIDIISLERVLNIIPGVGKKAINTILNEINIILDNNVNNDKIKPKNDNNSQTLTLFNVNNLEQNNNEDLTEYDKILKILEKNKKLSKLISLIKKFKEKENLDQIINKFKNDFLEPDIKKKIAFDKYTNEIDNLDMVISIINDLYEKQGSIKDLMETITLDNIQEDNTPNTVTLSTIHRSKGLEWNNVFIIKAYKNLFPSFRSMDSQFLLEEERNLFYVAITRAKNNLFIGIADGYYQGLEYKPIIASPFIDEINEYLDFDNN